MASQGPSRALNMVVLPALYRLYGERTVAEEAEEEAAFLGQATLSLADTGR